MTYERHSLAMSASSQNPGSFTVVNTRVTTITNYGGTVDTSLPSIETIPFSTFTADVLTFTTTGARASFSATTTESATSPHTASSSSGPTGSSGSKSNDNTDLDTAAAAGVGVGATLGVVFLILILFFLWRRRRAARSSRATSSHSEGLGSEGIMPRNGIASLLPEKDGAHRVEAPETGSMAEADGDSIAELDGGEKAVEVQGDWKAVEAGEDRKSTRRAIDPESQRWGLVIYERMRDEQPSLELNSMLDVSNSVRSSLQHAG